MFQEHFGCRPKTLFKGVVGKTSVFQRRPDLDCLHVSCSAVQLKCDSVQPSKTEEPCRVSTSASYLDTVQTKPLNAYCIHLINLHPEDKQFTAAPNGILLLNLISYQQVTALKQK